MIDVIDEQMREILFRGKRTDNGEWAEGYYGVKGCDDEKEKNKYFIMQSTLDVNLVGCAYPFYFTDFEIIPETVGQYTGLRDKNGKKIFEGDILEYDDGSKDMETVIWDINRWGLIYKTTGYKSALRESSCAELKIIGNIHDNPELLKEE